MNEHELEGELLVMSGINLPRGSDRRFLDMAIDRSTRFMNTYIYLDSHFQLKQRNRSVIIAVGVL